MFISYLQRIACLFMLIILGDIVQTLEWLLIFKKEFPEAEYITELDTRLEYCYNVYFTTMLVFIFLEVCNRITFIFNYYKKKNN